MEYSEERVNSLVEEAMTLAAVEPIEVTIAMAHEAAKNMLARGEKEDQAQFRDAILKCTYVFDAKLGLVSVSEDERLNGHFQFFQKLATDDSALSIEENKFKAWLFQTWVANSNSPYAKVYRLGKKNASAEIAANNVKRAANGRRLIGATSRAKVAKEAEAFRHLSKEKAAYELAGIVNLDSGTIKRYLSEIFPGDKWRQ